tara:strand:+ start:891 stop:1097 length:207 start_codon:yes stop_codon:yes gene_type:complete
MAQYWYKKDKRVKRITDNANDSAVLDQVKKLKANGYVQVLDRKNPEASIIKKTKPKTKSKAKTKAKKK